jgi:hypothetical protein
MADFFRQNATDKSIAYLGVDFSQALMFKTLEKLRFYSAFFLVYPIKNKHLALHKAENLRQCAISLVCDPYEYHSFPNL